ncbi:MAG: NTP transferase domain-containing protein [Candidatus Margulisiibacteriota bacterium]
MNSTTAIILAAGKGTRFKSEKPKVLHKFHGKAMLHHVIETVSKANINNICLVVGYKKEMVKASCKNYNVSYAIQEQQLGTGHAVVCGLNALTSSTDHCIILAGDCPLIRETTIAELIQTHITSNAKATLLTAKLDNAGNYGRIIRNKTNQITAIREAKDCSDVELNITEFNSGIYCFDTNALQDCLKKLNTNNAQNEYYLTDVIEFFSNEGEIIAGVCIDNAWEVSGANTQEELNKMAEVSLN